ncbi:nuclear transport factor 2 family protein [Robiginitalea marina]|uniref:Nuclear transport factor 2 family protein n=1 Tax=Robiginitalea marina TaxID=2954105 RepID=A0ABT1AUX3_9FLAO|nr:nuclear transport factor 2 family protein [Robiginitalea marina]MCO5723686.1 nuclear transport factor 2 family protein [Robiginitalea marina]
MKIQSLLFSLFILGATHAQSPEEGEVRQTIDRFFEGFHARDTAMMRSTLGQDVLLQTIVRDASGSPMLRNESMEDFLRSMASLPDTLKIEERLLAYHIRTDADMAHAWTPYEFRVQGELRHCGVNSFQLFYDGTAWKIIYLADTRRREGCRP